MIKNLKMSTIIALCAGIITCICMVILYLTLSNNVSNAMSKNAIDNMMTALDGQSNIIELYVSNSEKLLKEYTSADEINNLLEYPNNPDYIKSAQEYTEKYFAHLDDWEGIYLSDWNTKVLAHSSPLAVGMVTREGDALPPYRATMTDSPNGLYNGGAFISPASKELILNL